MKFKILLLVLLCGFFSQGQIISWDFTSGNTPNVNLPGGTTSLLINAGTLGTSGCGSNGYSSNGWNVGEYLQIVAPTTGYNITTITLNVASSSSGPKNFKFQYSSTGTGGTFTDLGTTFVSPNGTSPCSAVSADFTAIDALDNNANTVIRIVFTGGEADGSPASGDAAGSGTFRVDDLVINGSSVGPTPTLAITPATTNLGTSCIGTATTPFTYTITNSGTANATGVTVVSNNAEFVVSGLSSTTIASGGGTATYVVTFTPSGSGARSGTITVASATSGSNSPTTALTGTGTATVSQAVTSSAATSVLSNTATVNGNVTTLGVCPASTQKGFVYSVTSVNAAPINGGTGVTTTPVAGIATGAFNLGLSSLTPNTQYSFNSYVYNGTTYTYGTIRTFTTIGVPVVSDGSFSGVAGTVITTFNLSSLSTNSPTGYNFVSGALPAGLSINLTTGAITGTPTATGTFTYTFTATNAAGTSATSATVTITISPTAKSDVVTVASSESATVSSLENDATVSTTADGTQVWKFMIRDGGATSPDADALTTNVTAIKITQSAGNEINDWSDAIQSCALFDGTTFIANGVISATSIDFTTTGLVTVPDNGTLTLTLRLSVQTNPNNSGSNNDGEDFGFSITTTTGITAASSGSGFSTSFTAAFSTNGLDILSVVADQLVFSTQPTTTGVSNPMSNVVVSGRDANGNLDKDFVGSVALTSTGTMNAVTPVVASNGSATFTNITHTVAGTGFTFTASSGALSKISDPFDITTVTVLQSGDLAIIAVNTNIDGSAGLDQVAFVCFQDITQGTTIYLTDNGYERVNAGQWGGTEGVISITRTGSTLPKGTVLVFQSTTANVTSASHFDIWKCGAIDTNWTKTALSGTSIGGFNLNSNDDVYIMQGGVWTNSTAHASTYTGNVLYGWTESGWQTSPSAGGCNGLSNNPNNCTAWSTLYPGMECFYTLAPTGNAKVKFNNTFAATTNGRYDWIALINNNANWVSYVDNTAYNAGGPDYLSGCNTLTIASSTYVNGKWNGKMDTNWFNCGNWDTLKVPDETVDVQIVDNSTNNQAIVNASATYATDYGSIAKVKDLTISGEKVEIATGTSNILEVHGNLTIDATAGSLDMDDSNASTTDGVLKLYGNWTNSQGLSAFEEGNGTVQFEGSTTQIINSNVHSNPEQFYHVVLNNNFTTSASNNLIAGGNLEVKANKTLTISSSDYARVNSKLTNNGNVYIANNGQLLQVDETDTNDGDYSGTKFQMQRTAQVKNFDYIYWSSPTENFPLTSLPTNNRYEWDATHANTNGTTGNWVAVTTTNMSRSKGYIARASNGVTTAQAFPVVFTGKPFNGTSTIAINRGNYDDIDYDAEPSNPNNVWTTKFDDNWNLVGNPYPSAIDAEEFLQLNQTKILGSIWVWKHGLDPSSSIDPFYDNFGYNYSSNDYIKFNGLGSTEPDTFNGQIGAGQGFLVNMLHTTATPNTISFTNGLRSDASYNTYDNTNFFRTNNNYTVNTNEEKHRIWLDIINPSLGQLDRTLVGYAANATYDKDYLYDCVYVPRGEISIFSLIQDDRFSIQGRSLPFDSNDIIPMGVKIVSAGNHKIAIKKVDGLFVQNQDIYLEDTLLNIIHDLRQSPYEFTSQVGVFTDRFKLRYTTSTLGTTEFAENGSVVVATHSGAITIKSIIEKIAAVTIYDVLGREIATKNNVDSNEVIFDTISARNQALIVKIKLDNGQTVTKKVIL